jgi:hypothetical protein
MHGTEVRPAAKRISRWGLVSLVLLLAGNGFGEYNLYVHDHTARPWVPWDVANRICIVVLLAAAVCGVIAMRRGSKWWALTVALALLFVLVCYFGDL